MYERFTDKARKVMQLASHDAQRSNHEFIDTEHILVGLMKESEGLAANVLKNLGVDLQQVYREIEKIVPPGPESASMGKPTPTARAKQVLENAIKESAELKHGYVGTEHLLLGLARQNEGVAADVLKKMGIKPEDIHREVRNLLPGW